jgi:hypothetical protein
VSLFGRGRDISNSDNVIDSRDVIKRIEALEGERDTWIESETELSGEAAEAAWTEANPDESSELKALKALESEAEGYCDWIHGANLIRDNYFVTYAQESTEDIAGEIPSWVVVDWEATAEGMQIDYTSVEFDGVTYWVR